MEEQNKKLQGDLQTAHREMIAARKQTEVEKFKTRLSHQEQKTSADAQVAVGKLQQQVSLESEKLRVGTKFAEKEAKLKAQARDNSPKGDEKSKKE